MFDLQGKSWARQLSPQTFLSTLYVQPSMVCSLYSELLRNIQDLADCTNTTRYDFSAVWSVKKVLAGWKGQPDLETEMFSLVFLCICCFGNLQGCAPGFK